MSHNSITHDFIMGNLEKGAILNPDTRTDTNSKEGAVRVCFLLVFYCNTQNLLLEFSQAPEGSYLYHILLCHRVA